MAEIVVLNGSCAGTVFVLPEIPTVLGRSPESHLQIGDPWISSMHAMFERRGDQIWVIDLESRNGTFVGDDRVSEASVPDGALLRFGRTEVRFAVHSSWEDADPNTPRKEERPREHRDTIRADGAGTMTTRAPPVREPELDPYALALRPATVLRLSLHAVGVAGSPEAAQRIRAALEACARAAMEEGGVVSRLGGVGVLALFGLTGSSSEDVVRALRAARTARGLVRTIGGLEVRAGVDMGPVLAGNTGNGTGAAPELAALGAAGDRAERLVALAAPGEILAGAGAAASAPQGLGKVGMKEVGGSPIEVWRDERL